MKIVEANKFHTDIIIEMLLRYKHETPVAAFSNYGNVEFVKKVLTHIFAGRGVALLAFKDEVPAGLLIGFIDQSIWDPELCILKELAYWVNVEFRGTSAAYRLLSKYNENAKSLLDSGRIQQWTISKMVNSPDLDYTKFGFSKVEETFSQGN